MVARFCSLAFCVGFCGCTYSPLKLMLGDAVTGGESSQTHGDQPGKGDELESDSASGDSTGDAVAGDPLPGDPLAGDAWAGDALAGDALAGDALAGDVLAGDALAGDPWPGDPWPGDALAGDAWGDAWSGDAWGDAWSGAGDARLVGDPRLAGERDVIGADTVFAGDFETNCQPAPACTVDATAGMSSGYATIGATSDLVPLCSGAVLLAYTDVNAIGLFEAANQSDVASFPVSAPPLDLELDAEHSLLYVTLAGETKVAQIELANQVVRTIDLGGVGVDLAAGNNGQMFVTVDTADSLYDVGVINGCTRTALKRMPGNVRELAVYDRGGHQLITGNTFVSPDTLTRFAVDEASENLTYDGIRSGSGGNCQDLAISSDGDHIAFACGGGNGPGYTIHDLWTDDFTTLGEFDVGWYPTCAAFDPAHSYLAASNGASVAIFDATTYDPISAPPLNLVSTACDNGKVYKLAFSRGGNILFALVDCTADNYRLYWWIL